MFSLNRQQAIRQIVAVAAAMGFYCLCLPAQAQDANFRPHMSVQPSDIDGVVVFSDGETPASDINVRLWDAVQERFEYRTMTDAEGRFTVPQSGNGRYYLIIGEVAVDLRVVKPTAARAPQSHMVIVVLPRKALFDAPAFKNPSFQALPLFLAPLMMPPDETEIISP